MLTRFVASASAWPRQPIVDDPGQVEDLRAVVKLRGRELLLATVLGGDLRVLESRDGLAAKVRAQLAFHEVASGQVLELDADELYLFELQTVELLPDAPGLNDALYLYGVMQGPFPAAAGARPVPVEGQLTVTRADLLQGVVDGAGRPLAYAPGKGGARCLHALLPGERADVIDRGRGIVLALPLAPGWVMDAPIANDRVVAQLVYDVLSALRKDLGDEGEPLPVPDRAALEAELREAGWRIDGDQAVRSGAGLLRSLLGGGERRTLPRQGTLDELIEAARSALTRVPGLPTAETQALRRRSGALRPPAPPPNAAPPPLVAPQPAPAPPPPPPSSPGRPEARGPRPSPTRPEARRPRPSPTGPEVRGPPPPSAASPRSDWMKDFVAAHRTPSRPPPRVSVPARAVAPDATPAWMADFGDDAAADLPSSADSDAGDARSGSPSEPDWKSDFDSSD